MKKTITYLSLICALFVQLALFADDGSNSINWYTNYENALADAQKNNKPIFILFEGSDWCYWCQKLDKEVLNTTQFANMMADKMVFVKMDFPMKNPLPQDQAEYNDQIRTKFGVEGYPSVVILNSNGNRLANMGYMPGGAANYADHVMAVINNR
ncbi:MAG: thioredoxin family protein [Parachlamydiales bacterium]|nr:thioredoxin family protein [Parachlamydiales bacterium]